MIATNDAVKQMVHIAEAVALEPCEAVEHGQEPCPVQYDDQDEWCLTCQAKKAVQDYMNA